MGIGSESEMTVEAGHGQRAVRVYVAMSKVGLEED